MDWIAYLSDSAINDYISTIMTNYKLLAGVIVTIGDMLLGYLPGPYQGFVKRVVGSLWPSATGVKGHGKD
jgi:hypothetical protein